MRRQLHTAHCLRAERRRVRTVPRRHARARCWCSHLLCPLALQVLPLCSCVFVFLGAYMPLCPLARQVLLLWSRVCIYFIFPHACLHAYMYACIYLFACRRCRCSRVAVCCSVHQCGMMPCAAPCCSVLKCVAAVCCSVLHCVAVCCSVLQCVAVCGSRIAFFSNSRVDVCVEGEEAVCLCLCICVDMCVCANMLSHQIYIGLFQTRVLVFWVCVIALCVCVCILATKPASPRRR